MKQLSPWETRDRSSSVGNFTLLLLQLCLMCAIRVSLNQIWLSFQLLSVCTYIDRVAQYRSTKYFAWSCFVIVLLLHRSYFYCNQLVVQLSIFMFVHAAFANFQLLWYLPTTLHYSLSLAQHLSSSRGEAFSVWLYKRLWVMFNAVSVWLLLRSSIIRAAQYFTILITQTLLSRLRINIIPRSSRSDIVFYAVFRYPIAIFLYLYIPRLSRDRPVLGGSYFVYFNQAFFSHSSAAVANGVARIWQR